MVTTDLPPCSVTAQHVLLHSERPVRENCSSCQMMAVQQSLLSPPQKPCCAKGVTTTKGIQHCPSNPYLHFIFRVSPDEMTVWFFAMLSVGFSKNLSSARPDTNKEETMVRQAIQYGWNGHNAAEESFLFCK